MRGKPQFKLSIDPERCVGHGRCYDVAPGLFAPGDDEGCARVLAAAIAGDQLPLARLAVNSCPEAAIALTELRS